MYSVCGTDYRLYATPLIKFQKACYQLVAGNAWYLAGDGRGWLPHVGCWLACLPRELLAMP